MKRSSLNDYDLYPKSIFAQNALYYSMSNHYRRLYNAKPCVDNSTPKSYKLLKQKEKTTPNRLNRSMAKLQVNGTSIFKNNGISPVDKIGCRPPCKKNDITRGVDSPAFQPRVLKTDVQSKLRASRNYHPPRKKVSYLNDAGNKKRVIDVISPQQSNESTNEPAEYNNEYEDDVDWLQIPSQELQATRSSSKPSSSDSAYTEEGEGMWSGGESRDDSPQQLCFKNWSASRCDNYNVTDNRYIKFLRVITDEVLRKGIFTNKALKKVFQEHIHKNKHKLDMKRMQEEVEKLQLELGIPKDDDLNDIDYGLGSGIDNLCSSDYGPKSDNIEGGDNRLASTAELIESIEHLNINSSIKEDIHDVDDWLYTKINSSNWNSSSNDMADNIRLSLKLPIRDNDNDSSIGCEILSGSSKSEIVSSSENKLDER